MNENETIFRLAGKEADPEDLIKLWLKIIGKEADETLQPTIDVLTQIINAPNEKAFIRTETATTFAGLIEEFETVKKEEATELMEQAKKWYDHIEKIFSHVVDAYEQGRWGVGSADSNLRMRRLVGISTMLGITSPSVKVPHNILMTLIGATVAEIQLKEMLERAQQKDPTMTFEKLVQRVANDYDTLREFLSGVEEKIYGSPTRTKEGAPLSAFLVTKREASVTKPEKGKIIVHQPTFTEPAMTVTLKDKETVKVVMNRMMSGNMLRGILSYVDALSQPELGDTTNVVSKWTANQFFDFYSQVASAISAEETPTVEKEMLSAFIEREKHLRFGKGEIPVGEPEAKYAPITEESPPFTTALRKFIINNFGAQAAKTKSFSVSAFFSAVAEKLGIGSSVLPSVVFDTWMNANLHTMLREIDETNTTAPRLVKIANVMRQAILPYGFDVEITEAEGEPVVRLKDYLEGKVYERTGRSYSGKPFTDETDKAIHNRFTGKGASPIYKAIANAFRERRMYLHSPKSTEEGVERLIDVTKVGTYGKSIESKAPKEIVFKGRSEASTEEAGKLMFKDIEDLLKHWMTTHYTSDGRVFLVEGNPFYEMLKETEGIKNKGLLKTAVVDEKEVPVVYVSDLVRETTLLEPAGRGKYKVTNQESPNAKTLNYLYKRYIDRFRKGGFISLLGEQTLKNALYIPEGAKEGEGRLDIRALQALIWVCTRKGL